MVELGGRGHPIPCDVADADALDRAAAEAEDQLGPLDVWVNNAMTSVFAPFTEIEADEFRRVTEVTYLGSVFGTMAALRRMVPRDRGSIVQVGSALGYRGIPLQSAYCGAKHGIQGFIESLRTELIHDGSNVQLSIVQLPALNTPQFEWVRSRLPRHPQPVPPIFQPEVAARGVLTAAQDGRREIWVGGPTVKTIVGAKLVPAAADWYLARNGYDSQQTDEPVEPGRPGNLFEPVPGEYSAHGRFDDRAKDSSAELWLSRHRGIALAGGAGLVAAAATALVRK
jgi:NAD(P)-dependent dehydrogenase (short-subunit alcohol dehydrogenase family)